MSWIGRVAAAVGERMLWVAPIPAGLLAIERRRALQAEHQVDEWVREYHEVYRVSERKRRKSEEALAAETKRVEELSKCFEEASRGYESMQTTLAVTQVDRDRKGQRIIELMQQQEDGYAREKRMRRKLLGKAETGAALMAKVALLREQVESRSDQIKRLKFELMKLEATVAAVQLAVDRKADRRNGGG